MYTLSPTRDTVDKNTGRYPLTFQPQLQSGRANLEHLPRKGRITRLLYMALSRNMQIGKRQEKKQDALQSEVDALEDDLLLQEYYEVTYTMDPDANPTYPRRRNDAWRDRDSDRGGRVGSRG